MRRRSTPQAFAFNHRQREPAPVVVRYVCPRCGEDHRRDDCPRRDAKGAR